MDSPSPLPSRAPTEPRASQAGDAAQPARPAVPPSPWALLARLVRPQGRRGELTAELLTDFPERFHQRRRLYLIPPERVGTRPREIELENFWFLRSRIILKFRGIDSINDAEAIRGFTVAVPAEERAPLEPGSVYAGDLIGCHLIDLNHDSLDVGAIVDLDRGSSASTELLVVHRRGLRGPDREVLIPLVKEYLVRIDPDHRRVEMRLPDGLLDINAPITDEEKQQNHAG
ncbi:MAG TPA: ribosome maturation factor RimM [Acidobacteriaceae bacterium]|jgi:16S rRNA processing protein RimM|nr:ribosome maturation factor RimM [Acidobacteriaceae bacterium]